MSSSRLIRSSPTSPLRVEGSSNARPTKRSNVLAACLACHKAKAKCNAARPTCCRCGSRQQECIYDVEPDTSRILSLKRKYNTICEENERLWELYNHLRTDTEPEVTEIVHSLRAAGDPLAVLDFIRHGHLRDRCEYPPWLSEVPSSRLIQKIDAEALEFSEAKVRARPWTVVAGDGVVSELISNFFHQDGMFMPFLEQDLFLEGMRIVSDPSQAIYCSPALVNAVCAYSSFTSNAVQRVNAVQRGNLGDRFYEEFLRHRDGECGTISITLAQALMFAYAYSSCVGRDCAGKLHRYAATEMLGQLAVSSPSNPKHIHRSGLADPKYRRFVSRCFWGMFTTESMAAYLYLQPSLIPVPTIPRLFCDPIAPINQSSQTLDTTCDMLEILYEAQSYCFASRTPPNFGDPEDVKKRVQWYQRLKKLQRNFLPIFNYKPQDMQQYHYIRACYDFVVCALFRPVINLKIRLPNTWETTGDLILQHSTRMITEVLTFFTTAPTGKAGGGVSWFFGCCCSYNLIHLLAEDPRTHQPFARSCRVFFLQQDIIPAAHAMLVGLAATAERMKIKLPESALPYFQKYYIYGKHVS